MMKRLLSFILSFVACITVSAQLVNPYLQAYQYGQELARQQMQEQQQANQDAYNWGRGLRAVYDGMKMIASGDYRAALDKFQEAYSEYNYIPALERLGLCHELGIGFERNTDQADQFYKSGAYVNDRSCVLAQQRIRSNGHYPASYRETFLQNLRAYFNSMNDGGSVPNVPSGGFGGSGSNNNSVYTTCRICGGTGVCTSCNGRGGEYQDTGYYTGSGNKSWISCGSCRGNKRCFNCHGTGRQ